MAEIGFFLFSDHFDTVNHNTSAKSWRLVHTAPAKVGLVAKLLVSAPPTPVGVIKIEANAPPIVQLFSWIMREGWGLRRPQRLILT